MGSVLLALGDSSFHERRFNAAEFLAMDTTNTKRQDTYST